MDLLKRSLAPVLPEAWELIDQEATRVLKLHLAGRKLVDFDGPHGWKVAAVNTGRLKILDSQPVQDVHIGIRQAQPLVELRTPIRLPIMELDLVARGAEDPDLALVAQAAERVAQAEDNAIFNGLPAAGIHGLLEMSRHEPRVIRDVEQYSRAVLDAIEVLRKEGINGPYAIALGTELYDELFAATEDGYPIAKQIQHQIIEGAIVRAPAIDGGVVLSLRGGDYELTVGHDLSIGYAHHDRDTVELYLTESFTFRVLEPAAAVRLQRA
jgi:uncharacterized linocin/CFP29 family protein